MNIKSRFFFFFLKVDVTVTDVTGNRFLQFAELCRGFFFSAFQYVTGIISRRLEPSKKIFYIIAISHQTARSAGSGLVEL